MAKKDKDDLPAKDDRHKAHKDKLAKQSQILQSMVVTNLADDPKMTEKSDEQLNKLAGANIAGRGKASSYKVYPSGILSLDRALGNGGFLGGRIVAIQGHEGCGKTLL